MSESAVVLNDPKPGDYVRVAEGWLGVSLSHFQEGADHVVSSQEHYYRGIGPNELGAVVDFLARNGLETP